MATGLIARLLLVSFAVLVCNPSVAHPLEGEQMMLCGVLKSKKEWGPPNFGETPEKDIKIQSWFLHMPDQKNTIHNTHALKGMSIIKLSLTQETASIMKIHSFLGKRVVVKGRVWSASSQGDTTDFVIAPEKVRKSKSLECKNSTP